MTKKNSLALGIILFVAVVLASYFVMLPGMKVQSYKKTATTKHDELNEKLTNVIALLDSNAFIQMDPSEKIVKSDVESGNKTIKEAEATLNAVRSDLTTVNKLPATEWTGGYDGAEEARKEEEAYLKEAEAFISEMKALLGYMEKQAKFIKANDDFEKAALEAGKTETPEDYAAKMQIAFNIIEPAIAESEKTKAPESIKDAHEYSHKSAKEMTELLKKLTAALQSGDSAGYNSLLDQQFEKAKENTKKIDENLAAFVRDSKVSKSADSLTTLDRSIVQKLAGL